MLTFSAITLGVSFLAAVPLTSARALAHSSSKPLAQQYEQCYGHGYHGPTSCTTGLKCVKHNNYYSQCVLKSGSTSVAQQWEQCGGRDFAGPTACAAGLVCKSYGSEYYSQCVKTSGGSSSHGHTPSPTVPSPAPSPAPSSAPVTASAPSPKPANGSPGTEAKSRPGVYAPNHCDNCGPYQLCTDKGDFFGPVAGPKCAFCGAAGQLPCKDPTSSGFFCFPPASTTGQNCKCYGDSCGDNGPCPCETVSNPEKSQFTDCGLQDEKICATKSGPCCFTPFEAHVPDASKPFEGTCRLPANVTCGTWGHYACSDDSATLFCVPPLQPHHNTFLCVLPPGSSGQGVRAPASPAPASASGAVYSPKGCNHGKDCPLYTVCADAGGGPQCMPCGAKGQYACKNPIEADNWFCFHPASEKPGSHCGAKEPCTCEVVSNNPDSSNTFRPLLRDCGLQGQSPCTNYTDSSSPAGAQPFCFPPYVPHLPPHDNSITCGPAGCTGSCKLPAGQTCGTKGTAPCQGKDYLCVPPLQPKNGKCEPTS